jgi:hypothetical protein
MQTRESSLQPHHGLAAVDVESVVQQHQRASHMPEQIVKELGVAFPGHVEFRVALVVEAQIPRGMQHQSRGYRDPVPIASELPQDGRMALRGERAAQQWGNQKAGFVGESKASVQGLHLFLMRGH